MAAGDKADAALRRGFVNADRTELDPPPLTRLLRAGGGQEAVRLKLALTVCWAAQSRPEATLRFPVAGWASAVDLPDEPQARRRVRDAFRFLEADLRLVALEGIQSRTITVQLRKEDGSGQPYTHPRGGGESFVLIPRGFFTFGWLLALPAAAVATFLALFDARAAQVAKQRRAATRARPPMLGLVTGSFMTAPPPAPLTDGGERAGSVWVAPSERKRRYGLSEDTWLAGLRVLQLQRLVSTSTDLRVEGGEVLSKRVHVWLRRENLDRRPGTPPLD